MHTYIYYKEKRADIAKRKADGEKNIPLLHTKEVEISLQPKRSRVWDEKPKQAHST